MIKLKTITESSWLIVDGERNKSVGLLSKNPNNAYFMLFGDQKAKFKNKEEMIDFFNFDVFENVIEEVKEKSKENFVAGYPVDLPEIYAVENHKTGLPIYTKTEKSDVWHCAGYYCIQYPKGWLQSYCPKYQTLKKYKFQGPFKTEVEMRGRLSYLKKQEKDNE